MSNRYNPVNDVYICECGSLDHQFVFRVWDFNDGYWAEDDPCCSLEVFLTDVPFWQRLKRGLAYIFGYKSRFGQFDCADISYDDAQRLTLGLLKYRRLVREYRDIIKEKNKDRNSQGQQYV